MIDKIPQPGDRVVTFGNALDWNTYVEAEVISVEDGPAHGMPHGMLAIYVEIPGRSTMACRFLSECWPIEEGLTLALEQAAKVAK